MGRSPFRTFCGIFTFVIIAGCTGAALGPTVPGGAVTAVRELVTQPATQEAAIYVAYPAKNDVEVFPIGSTTSIKKIATSLKRPVGAVMSASGDLFVADAANKKIEEFKAGANAPDTAISTSGTPTALALSPSGEVYVSSGEAATIAEYAFDAKLGELSAKAARTIHTGRVKPDAIAVDEAGNVFVSDTKGDSVWVVAPKSTAPKLYLRLKGSANGLAVEGSGKQETLFVSSLTDDTVETFVGGSTKVDKQIVKGLDQPEQLALASDGELFVANSGGSGSVVEYAKDAVTPSTTIDGYGIPDGIAIGTVNHVTPTPSPTPYTGAVLYVADSGAGGIVEYPVTPGSPKPLETLTNDLTHPNMLAVDGTGNLFVQDTSLGILLEFPKDKKKAVPTHVSDPLGCATGCGFTVDTTNNLWVSGSGTANGKTYASVNEYAYQSGSQAWSPIGSVLGVNGLGATFENVNNVAVDASGNTFVVDNNSGHVFVNSYGASSLTGLKTASEIALNEGRLYISTSVSGASQIFAFNAAQVVTDAETGTPASPVETIALPSGAAVGGSGITFDAQGDLFVADDANGCVYGYKAAAIASSASGTVTPSAYETICGLRSPGPYGVAVAPRGSTVAPSSSPSPTPVPTSTPTAGALSVNPTSIVFSLNTTQTFTAQETGYTGPLTATSSNTGVATVGPASANGPSTTFTVTPIGGGTCTIAVQDTQGNTADVSVTVNAGVIIIDRSHVKPIVPTSERGND
jgi:sugar lactone lactonase YvrE